MAEIFQEYIGNRFYKSVQGDHVLYILAIEDFNKLPVKRWKYNRPEDKDRVAEIRVWMEISKRMDGMIYLACIDDELVCYESNHRREALKGLKDIHDIIIDVMWNSTHDDVKREFMRLNKSVSVPELYMSEDPEIEKAKLVQAVHNFCKNYASMLSTSPRPHRPNFNRDAVTDEFYRLMTEHKISIDELMKRIGVLNRQMMMRDKSKLSPKVIAKCEESGLWLFAWSSRLEFPRN